MPTVPSTFSRRPRALPSQERTNERSNKNVLRPDYVERISDRDNILFLSPNCFASERVTDLGYFEFGYNSIFCVVFLNGNVKCVTM